MGGFGAVQADAAGLSTIAGWKSHVEAKAGTTFSTFEVIHYSTQVVAGTNYHAKIKIGDDEYAHAKIWEKLPHTNEAPECIEYEAGKTLDEAF